jgi:prepilin-type N-terminal cleavage/methylation domain-containing protein
MNRKSLGRKARRGLTLIELIVVLMILIALAGMLIPMLPSMLSRAHDSTCSNTISETNQNIQTYLQLRGSYPNNLDALGDGTALIDYLANGNGWPVAAGGPGNTTNMAGGQIVLHKLSAAEANALTQVGITQIQNMVTTYSAGIAGTGFDETFNNYNDVVITGSPSPSANAVAIASGVKLASLTAGAITQLSLPATGTYVVLGIGPRSSMIGVTMAAAPVHFGTNTALYPEYGYQRFVAVFKIADTAVASFNNATLVLTASITDVGLSTVDGDLQSWYQLQSSGS